MQILRQGTVEVIQFGPFVDKDDGVTLKTDATTITDIDHGTTGIFVSKNGAAAAIRNAAVTASVADAYGMMRVTLDTTDTGTLGTLDATFAKAATYLPVNKEFMVIPATLYDTLFATQPAAAIKKFFDVATPTGTVDSIPDAVAGAAGGIAIVGSEMVVPNTQKVDIETIKTKAVTAGAAVTINASVGAATVVPTNTQFEARSIVSADYTVVGDLGTVQSADNNTILAHVDYGNAKLVRSTTPANKLDVNATGEVGLDFDNIKDATGAHTLTNITVPTVTVTTNAQTDLDTLTDAAGEPAQGAPPASAAMVDKIAWIYKFLRNKITTTTTQVSVFNDAGAVVDHKSTISDAAGTATRGEFGTGP